MVYDLGCGNGRIVLTAVKEFNAHGVGVEIREDLAKQAVDEAIRLGIQERIEIINGNLMEVDISKADVVLLYLTTSANKQIRPKLERELKSGCRVVSHDFEIPDWKPSKVVKLQGRTLYLYIFNQVEGEGRTHNRAIGQLIRSVCHSFSTGFKRVSGSR